MSHPLSVTEFQIPHEPPAIWIDFVLNWNEEWTQCSVLLKEGAPYFSSGRFRPSSLIEMMAQAYGFSRLAKLREQSGGSPLVKKAYLSGVDKFSYEATLVNALLAGEQLIIRTIQTHDFGDLARVQCEVLNQKSELLGSANLKLFATT